MSELRQCVQCLGMRKESSRAYYIRTRKSINEPYYCKRCSKDKQPADMLWYCHKWNERVYDRMTAIGMMVTKAKGKPELESLVEEYIASLRLAISIERLFFTTDTNIMNDYDLKFPEIEYWMSQPIVGVVGFSKRFGITEVKAKDMIRAIEELYEK